MRAVFVPVAVFALTLAGCAVDLGTCDMTAAKKVVYSSDGVPYFEGQALVYQSCAGSFCHSAGAIGAARLGVPHGLDFDVSPVSSLSTPAQLSTLASGIKRVRDQAGKLYDQVDSGEMPPGAAGERALLPWKALDASGKPTVDVMVPDVHDGAGVEVLRNWLSCGAPIVAGTDDGEWRKHGDILPSANVAVDATFAAVYTNVLAGTCKGCHNGTQVFPGQDLDFTSADAAYAALVGKAPFATGKCSSSGNLVIPKDCAGSFLYQKVAGTGPLGAALCGDPMPFSGDKVSAAGLQALCTWINNGALR